MSPKIFFLLTLLLALPSVQAQQPTAKPPLGVPSDAEFHQSRWYRVYLGQQTWLTASQKCEQLGGTLAVVQDKETHEFLKRLANQRTLWLGASNEQFGGDWKWVDGSKMTFTAWASGQPNNLQNRQHWLLLSSSGRWMDTDHKSSSAKGFICEWKDR